MAMKNGQGSSGSIRLPHLMLRTSWNLQELHAGVHHHLFDPGRSDFRLKFVEDDMVNHGAKGIRRFR